MNLDFRQYGLDLWQGGFEFRQDGLDFRQGGLFYRQGGLEFQPVGKMLVRICDINGQNWVVGRFIFTISYLSMIMISK